MQQYIALLRGINVGGKNKVRMEQLRSIMESCGYHSVQTHGNVGNVFFATDDARSLIVPRIEKALQEQLGFPVFVVIKSAAELTSIANELPAEWANDAQFKTDCMFLWPQYDNADVETLFQPKDQVDEVLYIPGVLVWRMDRSGATRSGIRRIFGTDFYKHITIRNITTVRTLASKVSTP